jgi:hypothetical protein
MSGYRGGTKISDHGIAELNRPKKRAADLARKHTCLIHDFVCSHGTPDEEQAAMVWAVSVRRDRNLR